MATNGSFYSDIYPALYDLLNERAGNVNPHQLGEGGVSGLTPFIRLVSGVGDGLILQPTYPNESFELRYGNQTSPGIIGVDLAGNPVRVPTPSRGLRPSPVITGLNVEEKKDGFRTCDISITAYTTEQVDLLSNYFLEPGFHILVEWGWNTNDGVSQIVGNGGIIEPNDIALYDRWKTIKQKREDSNFNYDATLGFVGGGGISFSEDETYTLTVKLRGIGQVAEYMTVHRTPPDSSSTDTNSSHIFSPENIENAGSVGKRLFMLMVNELPGDKQIPEVIRLFGLSKWTDVANYINMDSEIVEDYYERVASATELFSRSEDEVSIPSDIPLLSKDRFIRLELAFEILNSYVVSLDPEIVEGSQKPSRSKRISIDDTVITAFPHMFSTDKSKLFIPNTKAPDFKFIQSLTQIENLDEAKEFIILDKLEDNTQNLHPPTKGTEYTNLTPAQQENGSDTRYAFPARYPLTERFKPVNRADETFVPPNSDKLYWGWLKDLYINFDFFCDVISKPNFFIRDVVYELLNGLSSACNSIWNFQIVETTTEDENGDLMLKVIDQNFKGEVDFEKDSIKEFQARGVRSPFSSIAFDVALEGDLMSSIFQSRLEVPNEGNVEGRDIHHYKSSVFRNDLEDKVGKILQASTKLEDSSDGTTGENGGSSTLTALEKRKQIYQILTRKAGVFLKVQDREISGDWDIRKNRWDSIFTGNNTFIEDVLFAGTWDDPRALAAVYEADYALNPNVNPPGEMNFQKALRTNPPFGGMGEVSFTVLGVSGFKPSDRFRLVGLPEKFSSGIYQITDITQEVSEDGWRTSVKASFVPQPKQGQSIIQQ